MKIVTLDATSQLTERNSCKLQKREPDDDRVQFSSCRWMITNSMLGFFKLTNSKIAWRHINLSKIWLWLLLNIYMIRDVLELGVYPLGLVHNTIIRPTDKSDLDWIRYVACFADSWQLRRNFDVGTRPSESRFNKLSNKYSWVPKVLLDQRLGVFEVDIFEGLNPNLECAELNLFP